MAEARVNANTKSNCNGNGLSLYYNKASYYSIRVLMILHEKKLKYKSQIIELGPGGDALKPSFLKINPLGQVPVLSDDIKIIPDSNRIIDYLEDNFSNGKTPRLMPDKGTEESAKVESFRKTIENICAKILTFGCAIYPELTKNMLLDERLQSYFRGFKENGTQAITQLKYQNPDYREIYSQKIDSLNEFLKVLDDKENIVNEINSVTSLLDKVEEELSLHSKDNSDWWLCSKQFTVADIYLATLLHRLKVIGLSYRYWEASDTKYPLLQEYFYKVMSRPSVNATITQAENFMKPFIAKLLSYKSVVSSSIIAFAIISVFLYKKYK